MSQPLLHFNQRRPPLDQEGGTGVPEVMQADLPQAVIPEKLLEALTEVVGRDRLSLRIQAEVVLRRRSFLPIAVSSCKMAAISSGMGSVRQLAFCFMVSLPTETFRSSTS